MKKIRIIFKKTKIFFYYTFLWKWLPLFFLVVIPLLPRWFMDNLLDGHLFAHCCIFYLVLLEMITIPTRDMHKHNCEKENVTTDSFPFRCWILLQSFSDCDAVWPFVLIWKLMPWSLELYSVLYCRDLLRWRFHHEVMLDIHKFQILISFKRWLFP